MLDLIEQLDSHQLLRILQAAPRSEIVLLDEMRDALEAQQARIATLEAELAGRDAEIAGWMLESASAMTWPARGTVKDFATAIAFGAYKPAALQQEK